MKLNKAASFRAYIDESGDEGFIFREDGSGSSRWFVLSALVVRVPNDLRIVDTLKETRTLLRKPPKFPLHFVDPKHEQRIPYVKRLAQLPIRSVSVLIFKPLIKEPEKFQNEKYLLYRYATRLLLERICWLCRDHRLEEEGDGTCDIVFSNRSNMSYAEIRNYMKLLLQRAGQLPQEVQLVPGLIIPEKIRTVEHSKLAGLQAADAIASSFHFAVKKSIYGETEAAYAQHLRKTIYRHKKNSLGYGLKVWPEDLATIKTKAPEALNLGDL